MFTENKFEAKSDEKKMEYRHHVNLAGTSPPSLEELNSPHVRHD